MSVDATIMPAAIAVHHLAHDGRIVTIDWADGERSTFHALWLRDACPCAECAHPSGQRLLDTLSIPEDIALASASVKEDGSIEFIWEGDSHTGRFTPNWLRSYGEVHHSARRESCTLWDSQIQHQLPRADFDDVASDDTALRDWLAAVSEYGFALLHGVPAQPGQIFKVVDLFGYVRETNYGRLFDVQSVVNPNNLAFTGLALGAHTDNPYRDPTPTLQLLHCLSSSTSGGESTLVDGFRVAEALRAQDEHAFELLCHQPLLFRFRDETTELATEVPVITLNKRGEVTAIHFNNRSKMPLVMDVDEIEPYYAAFRSFGRMLGSPDFQITLNLEPGDLMVMDNTRVLHGRTGFSAAGSRHLQGCYADRDGLGSRLAVLNRSLAAYGKEHS